MMDKDAKEGDDLVRIAPMFRKHLRPKKDTPNLIAKLPPELRNRIYELHLSDTRSMSVKRGRYYKPAYDLWHEPPFLRTCKQIRNEAAPMFYKTQRLIIVNGLNSIILSRNLDRIRATVELCGPKPFASFKIYVSVGAWEKLEEILPLLELMRTSGFEPALEEYHPRIVNRRAGPPVKRASNSSIFRMRSDSHWALQGVFEQAVAMGRRARDERWAKEKLDGQFAVWKKKALSTRGKGSKGKKT